MLLNANLSYRWRQLWADQSPSRPWAVPFVFILVALVCLLVTLNRSTLWLDVRLYNSSWIMFAASGVAIFLAMLAHEGAHCLSAWLVDGRHTAVVFRGWKFVTVLGDVTSFSVSQRAAVYSSGPAADLVALSVTLMLSSLTQMNLFMPFAAIFALLLSNLMPVWSSDGQQIWRLLRPGIFVSVNDETE